MHTFFGISFEFLRFVYWNYIFLEWSLFSISSKFELKVKLWNFKLYIISIFKWKNNDEWQFQKYERCSLFIAVRWKYIVIQIMKIWCALPRLVALIPKLICVLKQPNEVEHIRFSLASLGAQMVKNPQHGRPGFNSLVGKIPWRWEWQPTPVFLTRESHGQRSLTGYPKSPWGLKELVTPELLTLSP